MAQSATREHQGQQSGHQEPGQEARQKAQQMAEQAQHGAQELKGEAKKQAQQASEQAKSKVKQQFDQQSTKAGEKLTSAGQDLRAIGDQLNKRGDQKPAKFAQKVGDKAEEIGTYLKSSSPDKILTDAEKVARKEPWAVIAGGIALGFVGSRLLKASSGKQQQGHEQENADVGEVYVATPAGSLVEDGHHAPAEARR